MELQTLGSRIISKLSGKILNGDSFRNLWLGNIAKTGSLEAYLIWFKASQRCQIAYSCWYEELLRFFQNLCISINWLPKSSMFPLSHEIVKHLSIPCLKHKAENNPSSHLFPWQSTKVFETHKHTQLSLLLGRISRWFLAVQFWIFEMIPLEFFEMIRHDFSRWFHLLSEIRNCSTKTERMKNRN